MSEAGTAPGELEGRPGERRPAPVAERSARAEAPSVPGDEPAPVEELPEQVRVRLAKLDRLRAAGVDPYPVGFPRTTTIADLRAKHPALAPDARTGERVGIAGRVILSRIGGKLCFATLRDGTGDLQVMLSLDRLGPQALEAWKSDVDLGDHVGVEGEVVSSRRGELSVLADRFAITSKGLRPLPEKHKGLSDPEARVRQRYVDLIVNPEARAMLQLRSSVVRSVRETLQAEGFVEVETPMLQVVHGGANARPFRTHINAYDLELYLRIAPELYLKRLLVGGAERIFEINRNFRNEGADATHNPEFTMLEMYEAYGDYDTMRLRTQRVVQNACEAAFGDLSVRHPQPDGSVREHDISGDWPVVPVLGGLSDVLGERIDADTPARRLRQLGEQVGVAARPDLGWGALVLELYEHLLERRSSTPVFYRDFPAEVSPLTRRHRDDPRLAERWDLVAFGAELGTGYSELIDPVDQRERFRAQSLLAAGGDEEAMQLDEDFLLALEYGMPPSGGQGMGIDRLLMMLTGKSIRETVLFPLVKPG